MALNIVLAGCTGWVGSELVPALQNDPDLELTAAISRKSAGKDIAEVVPGAAAGLTVTGSVVEALEAARCDVFIDYTLPPYCVEHARLALGRGIPVVMGATGLTPDDFAELDSLARENDTGLISANFSLTASLLQHFAVVAAKYLPTWEIVDYADPNKLDVPSGTGRELAEEMGRVKPPEPARVLDQLHGPIEARGAELAGSRLHSVRQPGYGLSIDVTFGMDHERLVLHHMADTTARPYVEGTILAAKNMAKIKGVVRGLAGLLFADGAEA